LLNFNINAISSQITLVVFRVGVDRPAIVKFCDLNRCAVASFRLGFSFSSSFKVSVALTFQFVWDYVCFRLVCLCLYFFVVVGQWVGHNIGITIGCSDCFGFTFGLLWP